MTARMIPSSLVRRALVIGSLALALAACRNGGGGGAGSPTATLASAVPEGYRGTPWGTSREEIAKKHPDARPGKRDPSVLVRDAKVAGKAATEAFFFEAGALSEVEIRYVPKLTPQESGGLGVLMDGMFGPHEIAHSDDDGYQYAWVGDSTEVRLTYDLRETVPFGPVVTYAQIEPVPVESAAPVASATPAKTPAKSDPGPRFGAEVRAARAEGKHLLAVEGAPGKLTLVLGSAESAMEISLTADPKNGTLLGSASLPRAGLESSPKSRVEAAFDAELAKGDPIRLTFGGPAGMNDLVTIVFPGDRFISLDPKQKDPLVSATIEKVIP